MKCPKCGVESAIMGTRMETAGDQSPDTQTEVWAVMQYRCRNPGCGEYGKDVGETRHRVFPEEEPLPAPAGAASPILTDREGEEQEAEKGGVTNEQEQGL